MSRPLLLYGSTLEALQDIVRMFVIRLKYIAFMTLGSIPSSGARLEAECLEDFQRAILAAYEMEIVHIDSSDQVSMTVRLPSLFMHLEAHWHDKLHKLLHLRRSPQLSEH